MKEGKGRKEEKNFFFRVKTYFCPSAYEYYKPNTRELDFPYLLSWTKPCSKRVSILQQDPSGIDEQVIVDLFNLPRLGGKWCMSFLIGHFQVKSSIAVAFWFFEVCAVRFCVVNELFTAGLPAEFIVSVGSLGRANMMLEDPKLARTPKTSLTMRSCALFECKWVKYIPPRNT